MKKISSEIVKTTWQKMSVMNPLEAPKLINQMTKKQPVILAYLMAAGNDILNQDERQLLLYLGLVVWRIMSKGNRPLHKVSEKTLDDVETKNMNMLEYLEDESDTDFINTIEFITKNYNQQEVLKYVIEALMTEDTEEEEEEGDIRDENKGIMMIYLKTVIDCFDQ